MNVLIAIDSFKGSVSSNEASKAISEGIYDVYKDSEIMILPLADGGEGTVEALVAARGGELIRKMVTGPLGNKVDASYGIIDGNTAVIEVAEACGLPLVPIDERNPSVTTTFGVGELILDAIEKGCREFVIGLGGSATNDGGIGMLQALGFLFLDGNHEHLGLGGGSLINLHQVEFTQIHPELKNCSFRVACDVNNPLYGPNGAASIYGAQKGATVEMIVELDNGLKHYAEVAMQQLNLDIHNIQGAGAAGGLGAAFVGFLNASLQSGIDLVLDIIEMEKHLQGKDIVITGEGKIDQQTSMGKAPLGVARLALKYNVPVIALAGSVPVGPSSLNEQGVISYFSIISTPMSLEQAMNKQVTCNNLRVTANQLFRLIKSMKK
ncbi:glycerate kinase [Bacillus sp. DJP31]|uniref:glycerate kinase family protein n=1 Tax=Bacillus sp. DJP31 TaxID=3409789 RepID=UPI003BB54B3D